MLEFQQVTKYYGKTRGVEDLSFSVAPAEILGVIGENGSGKTTTFRLLLGLIPLDQGQILFNQQTIRQQARSCFGYLPEERSLFKDLTVQVQLEFFGHLQNLATQTLATALDYWLNKLAISHYANTKIKYLSKGNQQKVQLIAALLHDPLIIILDEPFTGLDVENVQLFKQTLTELKAQQKYILISSHQYDLFEEFANKILVIQQGKTKDFGYISDLKNRQPFRAVTITNHQENYYHYPGVIDVAVLGQRIRLIFSDERSALNFVNENLARYPLDFLKIELLPLVELLART